MSLPHITLSRAQLAESIKAGVDLFVRANDDAMVEDLRFRLYAAIQNMCCQRVLGKICIRDNDHVGEHVYMTAKIVEKELLLFCNHTNSWQSVYSFP
jgi:hypothetical protein